ncbi:MAG: ABC transporter substrate-binding protein, partial [Dactylosporangium sp.]|nr:ABC transporter substrate-binding protein [Dactylosporangium sp.]
YKEDLDKAKSLLEEAGLGDGGLTLTLTYTAGDENERRTVELWSAELAKLGIRLDGRAMPWDAQWSLAKSTDPNDRQDIFMMYWWPDYATPYSFLFNLFHSEDAINFNMSYYRNAAYDDLIDRGNELAATDRDQAVALFGQAQEQLMKDNPAVFIYDQSYVRPVAASLSGYVDNPAYPNVVFFYDLTRK